MAKKKKKEKQKTKFNNNNNNNNHKLIIRNFVFGYLWQAIEKCHTGAVVQG